MRFMNTAAALAVASLLAMPALAQTTTPSATTGQGTSGLQQNVPGATPQADLGTGAGVPRATRRTKEQRQATQAERRNRRPADARDRAYQDGGTLGGTPGGPATTTATTTGGTPAGTTGQGTSGLRN